MYKLAAPTPRQQEGGQTSHHLNRPLKPRTKRAAVLRVFLERGDRGLTCFESVPLAHDYVLRTTVSELQRLNGVLFNKRFEQVPGFNGSRVDCVRYTLTPEGAERARELLRDSLRVAT